MGIVKNALRTRGFAAAGISVLLHACSLQPAWLREYRAIK